MPDNASITPSNFRLQELRNPEPAGSGRSPMGPRISFGGFGGSSAGNTRPMVGSSAPGPSGSPKGFGVRIGTRFAEGGEAKAKTKKKPKKMAKGGSTASKRADGCATKGKTKGRFV